MTTYNKQEKQILVNDEILYFCTTCKEYKTADHFHYSSSRATGLQAKCRNCYKDIDTLYICFQNMIQRCYNTNHPHYKQYGGRGIKVQKQWHDSYSNFRKYILENLGSKPSQTSQIDRINNSKGYVYGNLKWSSPKENSNNRRCTQYITYKGVTQTARAFYDSNKEDIVVSYGTLVTRICKLGWNVEKSMITPSQKLK